METCGRPFRRGRETRAEQETINIEGGMTQTGEVISDNSDVIACWFIDTDDNEEVCL